MLGSQGKSEFPDLKPLPLDQNRCPIYALPCGPLRLGVDVQRDGQGQGGWKWAGAGQPGGAGVPAGAEVGVPIVGTFKGQVLAVSAIFKNRVINCGLSEGLLRGADCRLAVTEYRYRLAAVL